MTQALQTSATGINVGQQQINVIANNVANINTVAYKSANMTFETLFSNTLSHGSAATKEGGGTNPKQIGLGVKIGGISRNFEIGTFVNTGRDTDVMISGNGYFVVQDSDGKQYYTRDGVFTTDSDGNLVTQSGMKVVGASTPYSGTASNATVRIPTNLKASITDTVGADLTQKILKDLNSVAISSGTFNTKIITADPNDTDQTVTFIVKNDESIAENVNRWNQAIADKFGLTPVDKSNPADGVNESFVDGNGDPATPPLSIDINADGQFEFKTTTGTTLSFEPIDTNFLAETKINENQLTSVTLNKSVVIQDLLDYNDPEGIAVSSVTIIDENGILSCSYSDGSNLTTQINELNQAEWRYTSPDGVVVTGTDVTTKGSINSDSNMIIELASFVNEEGLVSINNNLWEWGPDAGEVFYGMAGEMAFGSLESGGYEGSNVDIAIELSNMISAQRLIQMNSRVFGTASSVMETLAYLGQ